MADTLHPTPFLRFALLGELQAHATTVSGVVVAKMKAVSTLEEKLVTGSMDALDANPNGIIIGEGLAKKFSLSMGDNVNVTTADGTVRAYRELIERKMRG